MVEKLLLSRSEFFECMGVCLCDSYGVPNCSIRLLSRIMYPGQSITRSLVAVGMWCAKELKLVQFKQCTIRKTWMWQAMFIKTQANFVRALHINWSRKHWLIFYFALISLVEFTLESETCECRTMFRVILWIQCNVSWVPHSIWRNGNNYLYHSLQHNCIVIHEICPFDYCDTSLLILNLNKSELQCMDNRSGILCGSCQTELSLTLGSNECKKCENKYLTLHHCWNRTGSVTSDIQLHTVSREY